MTNHTEILSFVSKHELSRVIQALKIADCVALQIDKSVDKYNADSLFVTSRYMDNTNFEMKASFLGKCHSELRGVIGMVDALQKRFQYLKIEDVIKAKMCIAHKSDLAFESVENVVPEFRHWLTDVKNVATYFRGSSYRQENLHEIAASLGETAKHFPRHHEVRFAEHLANVVLAVLSNHQMMCAHWKQLYNKMKIMKNKARGFLKDWSQTSFNLNMSAVALDILRQFTYLQKEAQRTFITLADLMQKRDHVLQRLSMIINSSYPGGYERKLQINSGLASTQSLQTEANDNQFQRNVTNLYVTTRNRNFEAVRLEVITCAKNFLEKRLDVDQDLQVKAMIDVANAENAEAMIKAGRQIVSDIFGDNYVSEFVDDAVGYYSSFGASSFKPHESNTAKLYLLLQKTTSSSLLNKLVQTFLITCPHSMITELVISWHTELKSDLRSSMSRNTVNDRLCIALNAIGTANFDPRPVVADFLSSKTRRSTLPDDELYQNREFVKKFFNTENNL
ncbi:hypothetical protein HELRODRAFT_160114 [Helobdella robusta]|uniref:Uncharacterized protein n=1 Tax=Helobdella robusta TaxID=6412 RepID=T1EPT7_HELRO|nr:hypothetical protein HELRODRAFT_160114 [Helobdella robusta]ESO06008.1 hypothetical protein HELRODRAFT_160114 [Helobdella robusta]